MIKLLYYAGITCLTIAISTYFGRRLQLKLQELGEYYLASSFTGENL